MPCPDHPNSMADSSPRTGCSLIRLAPLTAPTSRGLVRDPLAVVERFILYIGSLFVCFQVPLSFRLSRSPRRTFISRSLTLLSGCATLTRLPYYSVTSPSLHVEY